MYIPNYSIITQLLLSININSASSPITDSTCSANTLTSTNNIASESINENRKDAVIKVLGGLMGTLLLVIVLLIVILIYLIMRYYRDVHSGGEEGRKPKKLPRSDAGTQTINSDVIWQIATEENVSYNLMANHVNKNPPNKPAPAPTVSHSKSPVHDSKRPGGKKSKRPPPIPKTAQISDMMKQLEKSSDQPQPAAPKATKISDLMKRFEN